jgi:D-arabinose 1-dehydrogenase-like Zn-dependent alcohol dehydrogenase
MRRFIEYPAFNVIQGGHMKKYINFDQVKEAYEYLQSGRHFGKIVIQLD